MPTLALVRAFKPKVGFFDATTGEPVSNMAAPPDDQFSVRIKAVNQSEKFKRIQKFANMKPERFMEMLTSKETQTDLKALLKEHVVGFNNLDYTEQDGSGDTRELTTDDLFELGEFPLIMEIFQELTGSSQLKNISDKKKSKNGDGKVDEDDDEGN